MSRRCFGVSQAGAEFVRKYGCGGGDTTAYATAAVVDDSLSSRAQGSGRCGSISKEFISLLQREVVVTWFRPVDVLPTYYGSLANWDDLHFPQCYGYAAYATGTSCAMSSTNCGSAGFVRARKRTSAARSLKSSQPAGIDAVR